MAIFANPIMVWVLFLLVLGLVGLSTKFLLGYAESRVVGLALLATAAVCTIFWYYAATHRLVPPNQRWVVIDTSNGEVIGSVRKSGITEKPLMLYDIKRFPGVPEQNFCLEYTPALKEGYEIKVVVCGTYDASSLSWDQQYLRYNFNNVTEMLMFWEKQSKERVSTALRQVNYAQISTDRLSVSNAIRENLTPWFTDHGVSVSNLQLTDWDFTSEEVKRQVDMASTASIKKTTETQLLEAAEISRQRQMYEADTANLVMAERGLALETLFANLGIKDDNAKATLATQMTWFAFAQNPPAGINIILGVGGSSMPIASPVNVTAPAQPAAAVTPTKVP